MNSRRFEKWLLLEQSGELTPGQARKLARLLEQSAEARHLRDDLNALRQAVPVLDAELPSWTVAKIAARLRDERGSQASGLPVLKPLLAFAVCFLMAAGLLNFREASITSEPGFAMTEAAGVDVWNDPVEEELDDLENLLVTLSGYSYDIMEL